MDDQAEPAPEPSAAPEPFAAPELPPLPHLPDSVAANADEIRRLIDQGASSPEQLRELASKIREHKALEQSAWRAEVKPGLRKAKKGQFQLAYLREGSPSRPPTPDGIRLVLVLLAVVGALVVAATQSTVLWVLVPVALVLGYAYRQGRRAPMDPPEREGGEAPS